MNTLTIYTDGASRSNPGQASCGFVVYENGKIIYEEGVYLGIQTNNTAEYMGVIEGFRWVIAHHNPSETIIHFRMDSMLVAHQMKGEWKIKHEHLRNLYYTAKKYEEQCNNVTYSHVRREQNTRADLMANQALDRLAAPGQA